MEQDFFTYLPSEIIIDILSRLPFETSMSCKFVSKSWLSLIRTPEFIKSYFSKSFSGGLVLFQDEARPKPIKILEFIEPKNSEPPNKLAFNFSSSFPHRGLIVHSSVNGLLFLINHEGSPHNLFICNPITYEYIKLPPPNEAFSSRLTYQIDTYGFGVSKVTNEYKVVRMFREFDDGPCKCEVYTLRTGSWRSVVARDPLKCALRSVSVFFKGNLHWLMHENDKSQSILCFDLENERFSTFSFPRHYGRTHDRLSLSVFEDRLCLCTTSAYNISISLMNEYGDAKSWKTEFLIEKYFSLVEAFFPIKLFKDGDVLLETEESHRLYLYSSVTDTIRILETIDSYFKICSRAVNYTPSFLALKTFAMKNSTCVIKPTEYEHSRLVMRQLHQEFHNCVRLVKGNPDLMVALLRDLRHLKDTFLSGEGKSRQEKSMQRTNKRLRTCGKCKQKTNHDARNCGKMLPQ